MSISSNGMSKHLIVTKSFRWTARIWSLASVYLLMLFVLGGNEGGVPTATEMVALAFFPAGVVLGLIVAWWREGLGGTITVSSLGLFYLWMTLVGRWPGGPYFLLFAAPGFLFLASWLLASHSAERAR